MWPVLFCFLPALACAAKAPLGPSSKPEADQSSFSSSVLAGEPRLAQAELEGSLEEADEEGRTALWRACYNQDTPLLYRLAKQGANVNAADHKGQVPILLACYDGYLDGLIILLSFQASISVEDELGRTPLVLACARWHTHLVEILLGHGAQLEERGSCGYTALLAACQSGDLQTVQFLLSRGANRQALTTRESRLRVPGLDDAWIVLPQGSSAKEIIQAAKGIYPDRNYGHLERELEKRKQEACS